MANVDAKLAIASETAAVDIVVIARVAWSDADTDVCRALRALRSAPPVLAICGPCDSRRRAEALRAGADDFLSIPFDLDELLARAMALVRRATAQPRRARVGGISVDPACRQVVLDGRPAVSLTLREYDLLATLVARAGEVVSGRELARRMTPSLGGTGSNLVAVHISRLRDKLGPLGAQIETVRGAGYRLRVS